MTTPATGPAGTTPEETAARFMQHEARQQIRRSVAAMTADLGDPRSAVHDPLAALRALVALRAAVTQAERDAARRAREDGRSWGDIGEALGFAEPGGTAQAAGAAYEHVMPGWFDRAHPGWFPWTCPSCGGNVRDYGPALPPDEAEKGHAEGCGRFTATVRAWDASWEDGSDE